ncbi:MAG: hydantoinase/carbamoylase family amidase [Acetobacterales bacterium]
MPTALSAALDAAMPLAATLFRRLHEATFDGVGITRATYGAGEQAAHDIIAAAGDELGLERRVDAAGNLYLHARGKDAAGRPVFVGSHLDSVPRGGNYDGAAGVIAGIVAAVALRDAGALPPGGVTVMGIRGEENAWFAAQHIGARAALGTLDPTVLDGTRRLDTGRSLAEHMAECGFEPDRLRDNRPLLDPRGIAAFYELHIEQGPVLVERGLPVGIVTGIRGNLRFREASVAGEYAHSGAVPRRLRHDAVLAAVELIGDAETEWARREENGEDLVFTVGELGTDPAAHAINKVPGTVRFTVDVRSHDAAVLSGMGEFLRARAAAISERRGVTVDLGPSRGDSPAAMSDALRDRLAAACDGLGVPHIDIPCGAGHDAQDFAEVGVPTALLFVRNPHGSHNPKEHMEMADFEQAVRVLAAAAADA